MPIKIKKSAMKYKDSNGNMQDVGLPLGVVETDMTFTKSGVPADAKEVGIKFEKFSREKADKTEIPTTADIEAEVESQLDGAKADIVNELITQIGGMPIFGTIDDDNTITVTSTLVNGTYVLMYENASGVVEQIGTIEVTNGEVIVTYTNVLPTANANFDGSGAVYNGVGYKDGYRLSSSYTEKANTSTTTFLSGFILVKPGDTVYFAKGVCPKSDSNCKVLLYKTDGNYDIELLPNSVNATTAPMFEPYEFYDDGSLKYFTVPSNRNTVSFRFVGAGIGADAVVTVNEPIE